MSSSAVVAPAEHIAAVSKASNDFIPSSELFEHKLRAMNTSPAARISSTEPISQQISRPELVSHGTSAATVHSQPLPSPAQSERSGGSHVDTADIPPRIHVQLSAIATPPVSADSVAQSADRMVPLRQTSSSSLRRRATIPARLKSSDEPQRPSLRGRNPATMYPSTTATTTTTAITSQQQQQQHSSSQSRHRHAQSQQISLPASHSHIRSFSEISALQPDRHSEDVARPLGQVKGNRIREGHANYPLMYNMLTGIRVTVSKQISKPDRDVNQSDFDAANKLAFEITGNETTPSSRYDFKFKDYAPWVFRKIRTHLRLESMDYLMSLTSRYILSEVGSPGKSGSLFYYSYDYRFIIKTIRESEHKLLLRILPDYYQHIKSHPDTLLSRIYGLHRIQMPEHSGKIYFVVMSNIFPPDRDIHEIFDLKGSTLGRKLDDELAKKPGSVMKDINWLEKRRKIELGPVKRDLFIQQLVLDVDLLARLNILDYSLLIGIHYLSRGNRELIRQGKLQVLAPDAKGLKRTHTLTGASRVAAMRRVLETVEPQSLSESTTAKLLPEDGGTLPPRLDLALSTMYQDDGGLMATDERDRPTDMIYYLGVIDILTPYNMKKRVESVFKAVIHGGGQGVSAVHPHKYARRFLQFIVNSIKHHDDVKVDFARIGSGNPLGERHDDFLDYYYVPNLLERPLPR